MTEIRFGFILFLVASIACVGQLTNTIFIPAITLIGLDFHINPTMVQAIMGVYLFSYGFSQFIYGPLSDWWGRRPIVLSGLIIFTFGTLWVIFANSFFDLLMGVFIQGVGTGVGGMMIRTAMRDLYTGRRLQTASSYMSAVLILAPLVAPLMGGFLTELWGWRAVYMFLAIFSVIILVLQYFFLPETNRYRKQPQAHPRQAIAGYKFILQNSQFQGYVICLLATFAGVAVIEAVMGLLLSDVLQLSPSKVSLLFIVPLPFYLLGSYGAGYLNKWITLNQILLIGIIGLALGAISMLLFGIFHQVTLIGILMPASLFFLGAGILFPTATAGALEPFADSAGKAGALLGGLQNLGSGSLALLSACVPQVTQLPLGCMLVGMVLIVVHVFFRVVPRQVLVVDG